MIAEIEYSMTINAVKAVRKPMINMCVHTVYQWVWPCSCKIQWDNAKQATTKICGYLGRGLFFTVMIVMLLSIFTSIVFDQVAGRKIIHLCEDNYRNFTDVNGHSDIHHYCNAIDNRETAVVGGLVVAHFLFGALGLCIVYECIGTICFKAYKAKIPPFYEARPTMEIVLWTFYGIITCTTKAVSLYFWYQIYPDRPYVDRADLSFRLGMYFIHDFFPSPTGLPIILSLLSIPVFAVIVTCWALCLGLAHIYYRYFNWNTCVKLLTCNNCWKCQWHGCCCLRRKLVFTATETTPTETPIVTVTM